jgi:hypothetical protein
MGLNFFGGQGMELSPVVRRDGTDRRLAMGRWNDIHNNPSDGGKSCLCRAGIH